MRKQEFNSKHLPSPARRGSRSRTASPPAPLAIRKAPSGRRGKSRRQSHTFFLAPAAPGTPTRRHALGRLPTPAPSARKSATQTVPPASTQEVSESESRPATRGTAHSEVQGDA